MCVCVGHQQLSFKYKAPIFSLSGFVVFTEWFVATTACFPCCCCCCCVQLTPAVELCSCKLNVAS